jgi:hypothetical protein
MDEVVRNMVRNVKELVLQAYNQELVELDEDKVQGDQIISYNIDLELLDQLVQYEEG